MAGMVEEALGELCRIVLPIPQESYAGNPESSVAVCTLSDIRLLGYLASAPEILSQVHIVGRLLSENRGIDAMLRYLHENPRVRTLVVCGRDARGHRAGHSLFRLHGHGVDPDTSRISGSASPDPYLTATAGQIAHFRRNVDLVDMTGMATEPAGPLAWRIMRLCRES